MVYPIYRDIWGWYINIVIYRYLYRPQYRIEIYRCPIYWYRMVSRYIAVWYINIVSYRYCIISTPRYIDIVMIQISIGSILGSIKQYIIISRRYFQYRPCLTYIHTYIQWQWQNAVWPNSRNSTTSTSIQLITPTYADCRIKAGSIRNNASYFKFLIKVFFMASRYCSQSRHWLRLCGMWWRYRAATMTMQPCSRWSPQLLCR